MTTDIETLLERIFQKWIIEEIPNISRENTSYLRSYIKENNVIHILEIGTAHGYSTINFADEVNTKGWSIDTIEFSQPSYETAGEHIEQSGFANISQYFWDARDIIPHLNKKYDLIFIDGMKKASLQFLLLAQKKISIQGTIIIDDVIKFRHKMEDLYTYLHKHNINYEIVQIDSDDGIMIIKNIPLH